MIDVPVRVKDALKSGEYKKNYKITLIKENPQDEYEKIGNMVFQRVDSLNNFVGSCDFIGLENGDEFKISCSFDFANFTEINYIDTSTPYPIAVVVPAITDGVDIWIELEFKESFKTFTFTLKGVTFMQESQDFIELDIYAKKEIQENFIDNDNLIVESVKFDERMCSDTELKFGLCEGTSVEFQYFDKSNIYGKRIKVDIEIQYVDDEGSLDWHTIPMGYFDVDECSRQASTGIIKVTAINKLKSKYLDAKVNAQIEEMLINASQHKVALYALLNNLLNGYSIGYHSQIKKQAKLYTASRNITATYKNQVYVWTYRDGTWYSPAQQQPPYGPSTGMITVYMADFWFIPIDASNQYTNDYYEYRINLNALWSIAKYFLLEFFESNGREAYDAHNLGYNLGSFEHPNCEFWEEFIDEVFPRFNGEGNIAGSVTLSDGRIFSLNGHRYGTWNNPIMTLDTGDFTDEFPRISMPIGMTGYNTPASAGEVMTPTTAVLEWFNLFYDNVYELMQNLDAVTIYKKELTPIEEKSIQLDEFKEISGDITLRDIQSAVFEINCQYGKLDRMTDLFSGIELNNGNLFPRDDLYPAEGLYPIGASEGGYPSMYEKLWADEGNIRKFRNLIITYKTTQVVDEQVTEIEAKLQRTVNADGTDDYNMSDNWLFRNFTWTSAEIGVYADAMVAKMRNISWFPFEMWCAGLPYLEAGDEIEINTGNGAYKSYVLRRFLKGIQDLHDEMTNGTLDIF